MKNTPGPIGAADRLLLSLDTAPWGSCLRVVAGFATLPMASRWWGEEQTVWTPVLSLLGILAALRVAPALIRRTVPFSDRVRRTWAERRKLAKYYDSYQWLKLFWVGCGLGCYIALSGRFVTSWVLTASGCLVAGALGQVRWRFLTARIDSAGMLAEQERHSL